MELNGTIRDKKVIFKDTFPGIEISEISNSKHQISISNDPNRFLILNFGHCDLFVICYLLFAIWNFSPKLKPFRFDQTGCLQPESELKTERYNR